jgi:hypothetical protein
MLPTTEYRRAGILLFALLGALFLVLAANNFFVIPWADQLDTLRIVRCAEQDATLLRCAMNRHGAHWHMPFFVLDAISLKHFGWNSLTTLLVSWLMFLATAGLVAHGLGMFKTVNPLEAAVVMYPLFNFNQAINWFWPNQMSVMACVMFAVLAFQRVAYGKPDLWNLAVVAACAVLSVLNFAWGLAVAPVLIVAYLNSGYAHRWRDLGLLASLTVLIAALYVVTSEHAVDLSEKTAWSPQALFAMLGNIPSNYSFDLAMFLGIASVIFCVVTLIRLIQSGPLGPHHVFAFCLIGFALLSAFLISVGRSDLGNEISRSSRYMTLLGLYWAAVAWLYIHSSLGRHWLRDTLCLVFMMMMLFSGVRQLSRQIDYASVINSHGSILQQQRRIPELLPALSYPPDSDFAVTAYREYLRRQ